MFPRNILRLEMREGICLDDEFIYPVFFKRTTSVDYHMATFVLSRENNVTMQELVAYYNEKEDTDASFRNFEPEKFDFDNSLDTQAEEFDVNIPLDTFDDNYETLFGELNTPRKNSNDISRFNDNTLSFLSPSTKRLHQDIADNSPANLPHHNSESIRASRKNIIANVDYVIEKGRIENDPESAMLFDELEKTVADFKLRLQRRILPSPMSPPGKDMIEFAAFDGSKKKPVPRLKGYCG
jgi:hypothetical protein